MENIFDLLTTFVQQEILEFSFPIERSTRLEEDLGVTGDDAVELIIAYGKHFNVDVSKFLLADYFGGEGFSLMDLFSKKSTRNKELTMGDLEKGILAGKLDEEILRK